MRGLLLLWLGLALGGAAQAQSIPLRRYAHDQGLLGLADTCLLQAGNGSLWVCTESGLYRFNGHRFDQVPLQDQRGHLVSAVAEDAAQRLWVTTFDAVYVGDGNRMRQLDATETGPLHNNTLRLATPRWGTVLLNGQQALRAFPADGGRWRLRPLFDAATLARLPQLGQLGAAQAEADLLWLGCGGELCRVAADGAVTVYGQAQGLPRDRWQRVVRDRDGALWLRGDRHLMRLPAGAGRFLAQPLPDALAQSKRVTRAQLLLDPQGRVLMPTRDGLARWEGGRWRHFGPGNGLPGGGIIALLFDRAGDLWMSVDGEGVVRWDGYGWIENWDASQGMSTAPTWSIQRQDPATVLLGNEAGINRQRGADQPFRPWVADAGAQIVGLQTAPDGSLWSIGSLGELHHHDRDGRLLRRYPRLGDTAKRLFRDDAGRLWILAANGVYLLPQPDAVPQRVQALPAVEYSDIQQRRDGSLWLAGAAGVFRLRGGAWTPIRLLVDGASTQSWVSKLLLQDDGQVWAALYHPGVWQGRLDGDTLRLRRTDQPQLQELQIYLLRRTGNGWIWIGHNQGVDIYDGRRWSRLTQSQGLLWDDISESAFFEDRDGSVWIGNSKGVSHVLAPQRLFQDRAPSLTLDEFTRGGHPIAAGARLPWNNEPLHIEVGAPDLYDDRNRVSFRYRFEGIHTRWIHTPNFEIDHPPLPPGNYVFEIQLLDAYRRSASAPTRVAFTVAPVWWRSVPMLTLYALLCSAAAIAALHWRERRLHRRQRELADLVALRTQELEHDKRELEIARAALAVKATHDALTGLLNRAGILEALAAQMRRAQAERQPLAVAMIDLDHFKRINDVHGHLTGDAVLVKVALHLTANLRGSDQIGRYGGEELLGVLPGLPLPSHERLQHLRAAIAGQPLQIGDLALAVTASIGVAWYRPGESMQQLLARADEALYRAKHLGRNRVELQR